MNGVWECTYCGREYDEDDDICECGKGIGYTYFSEEDQDYDFYFNNIDMALENKRRR